MKRKFLLMALLCLSFWLKAQSNADQIKIGRVDTVYSEILKEKRPVLIYSPSYDTTYFTKPQFPVLYVLDGSGHFDELVTMIREMSVNNGNTVLPQMIIVGIANTQGHRTRDLTPSNTNMDPASGGGELFTSFIEKELIPYIDKNYATAPYRTFMGHSLGGLMVINTLLKHTALFNAYIALDPSMFYNNDELLKLADAKLGKIDLKGKTLFLGIANTMNPGMDTMQVRSDTTQITHHIRSILKLRDDFKKSAANNLRWNFKYYPDDDHGSMPFNAEYDGLRFVFQTNRFPRNQPMNQFFDKTVSATDLNAMIDAHYQQLSVERGYKVKPPEAEMNQLGYIFLQQKDYERSELFFKVNMDYYPENFNVYDSMGDYFLAVNNKQKAVESFKKALSIKFRPDIKEKLDKLGSRRLKFSIHAR